MPKKQDTIELKEKLAKYDARLNEEQEKLKKLENAKKALIEKIADEERKVRTHNLCCIGGLVYRYFGENITPESFEEILGYIFTIREVKELLKNETKITKSVSSDYGGAESA